MHAGHDIDSEGVRHDVLDVVTREGAGRADFHRELVGEPDIDAGVITAVLAAHGRVRATLETRGTLIALASLLRSLDAWQRKLIDVAELAAGCAVHAAATDRFATFGEVRPELRTLDELLRMAAEGRITSDAALRAQIELIDSVLRDWFAAELFGADAFVPPRAVDERVDPRAAMRIVDPQLLTELDAWSRALVSSDGASNLFRGFAGNCWRNGWVAVAVAGDQLGDVASESEQLTAAIAVIGSRALVQIDLVPQPRWRIDGRTLRVLDPARQAFRFDASAVGAAAICAPRLGASIITDEAQRFAVLEGDEHHVVAGPRAFVAAFLCGDGFVEAWARFRDHVELAYGDDDPPEHLVDAARDYPRASRRGLGAAG